MRELLKNWLIINMKMCLPALFQDTTNANALVTIWNIRNKLQDGIIKPSELSDEVIIATQLLGIYEEME